MINEQLIAEVNHAIYPKSKIEEADACAWVFYSPTVFDKYYFKFPPLGDNELRVRNIYSGLCHSDSLSGRGKWGMQNYPLCTGHESVSEVIAVGKNVTKFKPGDRVCYGPLRDSCRDCGYCQVGDTHLCQTLDMGAKGLYGIYFGTYSSHMQHPDHLCHLLPDQLDPRTTAPLMCAGITVFSPMYRYLKKGMKIAVLGVGGLGHLAVQFGAKMGMSVDAFCSGTKTGKEDMIKSLGAEKIHIWTDKQVLEKLAGTYDAIVHTIPVGVKVETMDLLLATLKPRGQLLIVGAPPEDQKLVLSFFSLLINELSIIGSIVGGYKDTGAMLEFCAQHKVTSLCEEFSWDDFPKALDRLENGSPVFRCVVNIDEFSKNFPKKH